tara:strand:- start:1876 stop:2010 length:135 start_codon:yes stop_codon:yes gene_type:complete
MRKKQKHSNFIGSTTDNKFVWAFIIIGGIAIYYYAFKGVKTLLK